MNNEFTIRGCSSFLPSFSSIQKNLPFDLSTIDKRILVVVAVIFAVIASLCALVAITDFGTRNYLNGYKHGQSAKDLEYAITQLMQDPSKPPRVSIYNLLELAKTHGSKIKNLDLFYSSPEMTQEQFTAIIQLCPNLESLSVISLTQLNNSCSSYLEKLTQLQKLSLICPHISDYKFLSHLKNLQEVFLSFETIEDHTLEPLKDLTSLKNLRLGYKKNMTEKSLQYISKLTNLEKLDFTYSTDNSVTNSCPHISDAHIIHLADLINLKALNLSESQITDAGLASLGKLTSLEHLEINGCEKITDLGLEHLKKMANLKLLRCDRNDQITPKSLVHLASLPALKLLTFQNCKNVSKNDVIAAGFTSKVAV